MDIQALTLLTQLESHNIKEFLHALYNVAPKLTFGKIPIIGSWIFEVKDYIEIKHIIYRIQALEDTVEKLGYDLDTCRSNLSSLANNEHKYYVVRNNVKHLLTTALPETTDALNRAIIEIIMQDKYDMAEHAAEIIRQLNSVDILTFSLIKRFLAYKEDSNVSTTN